MENKKDEQMIYIKDLIFAVLRRWRAVLIIALIGAILLGGMQAVSGLSAAKKPSDTTAQQTAIQQYEAEKSTLEQRVELAEQTIVNRQEYLHGSVMMQLNPYEHYEAQLGLHVETDYQILPGMNYQNPDKTADVLRAYKTVLQGETATTAMAEALQTENRFVSELLLVEIVENAGTLILRIKLPTAQMAQSLLPVLETQATAAYQRVKALCEHKMTVVELSVSPRVDTTVADNQKKELNRLTDLEKALADAEKALSGLTVPAAATVSVKSVVKKAVIFAVLGAVLGVFLTVCVLWVMHITGDKIYAGRNLNNRTGVRIIGTVGCEKKCAVDRLWYRLEGRSTACLATTPVIADICCRAKDAKYLLITGSGETQAREALVQAIAAAMPGVRVEDKGSLLKDGEALTALVACDTVVLVETTGVSRYSAVEKQLDIICDYGANLLGCVLMEK